MDEVRLSLTALPGQARRILFFRDSEPPFTERDRQVVSLLRPHIEEIWRTAERLRAETPVLTPREWEVLSLVASGMTAAEAGDVLFLSPATVRKHVENVRVRLGVHTVAAAAAIALPHPPPIVVGARSPVHLHGERA